MTTKNDRSAMAFVVSDIRSIFGEKLFNEEFVSLNRETSMTELVGNSVLEIIGVSFICDEDAIFGEVNHEYANREQEWYLSKSLNVNDIPGGPPKIWAAVADKEGFINSNYGHLVFSGENWDQYDRVRYELRNNPLSRRGVMIYTRPTMWNEYNTNGRSDFICTNTVQYLIRDEALEVVVQMRSSDGFSGLRNDLHWQKYVQAKLADDLNVKTGNITWQAGSLHFYSRDYYLIDHYNKTHETSIKKKKYRELYPDSPFC